VTKKYMVRITGILDREVADALAENLLKGLPASMNVEIMETLEGPQDIEDDGPEPNMGDPIDIEEEDDGGTTPTR